MVKERLGILLGFTIFLIALFLGYRSLTTISLLGEGGDESVEVIFVKTSDDADCILLKNGSRAAMIDTGEAVDAPHILKTLEDRGIDSLEYLILTHQDKDHIGGAPAILEKIAVKRVVEPYYEENDNMRAINEYLEEAEIPILYPPHNTKVEVGAMTLTIYPPMEGHYGKENNYSLAVLVTHGKNHMLFTGDALRKRTEELLMTDWPDINLLKVPHHGRSNSATEKLFDEIRPDIAVVTAADCDEAVSESAERVGAELYFTLRDEYVFRSDGVSLEVHYER